MCFECLSCIMVWWILMIKHYVYDLSDLFYIHVSSCTWRICSWQVKEKHPRRLWRRGRVKEDKARINRLVSSDSFLSSYFFFCTLDSISCKFYEYVGNPRPSVIRCLFMYNNPPLFSLHILGLESISSTHHHSHMLLLIREVLARLVKRFSQLWGLS